MCKFCLELTRDNKIYPTSDLVLVGDYKSYPNSDFGLIEDIKFVRIAILDLPKIKFRVCQLFWTLPIYFYNNFCIKPNLGRK